METERTTTEPHLTDALGGLSKIGAALNQFSLEDRASAPAQEAEVTLRLIVDRALSMVPDALAAFMRGAPDIRCRVREADWTDIPGHLLGRESDLAVADISVVEDDERFTTELLLTEPFFFVCRSGHPLAGRHRVSAADFVHYPLVGNLVPGRIEMFLAKQRPDRADDAGQAGPFRVKIDVATFAATRRILLAIRWSAVPAPPF